MGVAGKSLEIKELSIVNEVAKILSRGFNLDTALNEVLKSLYSFWDVRHSFIALYEPKLRVLRIVKAYGFTREEIERGVFKKGEGITGKVFKTGFPIVLNKLSSSDSSFLNKTQIAKRLEGTESFISVPIKVGGSVIGVLSVFKSFSQRESVEKGLESLMIVGTLLGMFLKLNEELLEKERQWEEEKKVLTEELKRNISMEGVVGVSEKINTLLEMVKKVAQTDSTVLILGESGTGKSLIAKKIHILSDRKENPFITINCAAIPENLLEAELFGYEKGAFTGAVSRKKGKFELADGGTVFLDEIGDMPLSLQAKLLRVLQDKEVERLGGDKTIKVDVRIIAATNKNLEELVREGKFREDLYYRLNVVPIHLPPLRERKEDIPLLAEHFLEKFNRKYSKSVRLSPEAVRALMEYPWHGNVRELENIVERLVIMNEGVIRDRDLPSHILAYAEVSDISPSNLPQELEKTERERIEEALKKTGYVKSRAAKLLGYTLRQLDYRIQKYGIEVKKF